jgi:hypothetical protein
MVMAPSDIMKQEVLGRTNHLLSFDTTQTSYNMEKIMGDTKTAR